MDKNPSGLGRQTATSETRSSAMGIGMRNSRNVDPGCKRTKKHELSQKMESLKSHPSLSCRGQPPFLPQVIGVCVWKVRDEFESSEGSGRTEPLSLMLPRQGSEIPSLAVKMAKIGSGRAEAVSIY